MRGALPCRESIARVVRKVPECPKRDDRHSNPETDLSANVGHQLDDVELWTLHRLDHRAFGNVDVNPSKVLLGVRPVVEKVLFVVVLLVFEPF